MKLKSFSDLRRNLFPSLKPAPIVRTKPKPQYYEDLLSFGDRVAMAEFMKLELEHDIPGIIITKEHRENDTKLAIKVLVGKHVKYLNFLRHNELMECSMRVGIEEARRIELIPAIH